MESLSLLSLADAVLPDPEGHGGTQLFTALSPSRPNRWLSFLLSATLHVVGFALLPPLTSRLVEPTDRELWIRQQRLYRSLRIRVPETLYLASTGPVAPVPRRSLPIPRPKPSTQASAGPDALAGRENRRRARRRFDLPPLPQKVKTPDTMLQPQFAAEAIPAAPVTLPEVFFWAPQTESDRVLKSFVTPGHELRPTQPRLLDAQPRFQVPFSEPSPVDLTGMPDATMLLAAVVGPSLPIQTTEAENNLPRTGVSADTGAGDPTNLLSLAFDPEQLREYLSVPPGNQLGRMPQGAKSGAITASEGAGHSGSGGTADTDGAGTGLGTEGGGGGQEAEGLQSAAALRAMALAAAAGTRLVHPATGVFDVVVQSAGLEGFPESAGVLSGKPVYSVFIATGSPRDWILQYCVPSEDDRTTLIAGPVVRLANPSRLTAPWPLMTMRPVVRHKPGSYVWVHGMVSAAGRFEELRVLGRTDFQEAGIVLAVLSEWEFRPARRDGAPVRVEILLAIPAE